MRKGERVKFEMKEEAHPDVLQVKWGEDTPPPPPI